MSVFEKVNMKKKMVRFYTRKGDEGYTGVIGDQRVSKSDPRIELLGTIDETNAAFGMARSLSKSEDIKTILLKIQRELYILMAEVAVSTDSSAKSETIDDEMISWLEAQTDHYSNKVQIPKAFIIPGDSSSSAALDQARAVVRRAERRAVELFQNDLIKNKQILKYLNRLSSLCFVLELYQLEDLVGYPTLGRDK
jgi:cob(I)alamin adenosyltransferase